MPETEKQLEAKIEACLFVYGEPVKVANLAKMIRAEESETRKAIDRLKSRLDSEESGLVLIESDDKIQLVTKPVFGKIIEEIVKAEIKEDLTPAAQETLSIVAYLGPISRPEIDYVRGVNSSFILRSLMVRGLVERSPSARRLSSFDYRLSFDALKQLGVSEESELPEYERYREISKIFNEKENRNESGD
ncbi:MAG TPA: SMC-Scp complex subunit ScpB [Candidatus Colwellbacteria bacterium]|nr:SMC-Scp complex subunit ScpB [Candidatus Colwellbacteria bacterium]HQA96121.1 SMC-Scp complex subunit ScpB [Candidatus Colwellbacteria bacterium]